MTYSAVRAAALGAALWLGAAAAWAAPASVRTIAPLTTGWRFVQADVPDAASPDFADKAWATVSLPHTWNRVGYYLNTTEPHLNRAANINKVQGVGWYRLNFTPDAALKGKRVWLQFDGASRTAEVWLNGVRVGEHKGGFSRFRLDVTAALRPGVVNRLAVRTDNTNPAPGTATADVLPLSGDFFVHGGLYRPVSLVATAPLHVDMMDFGGPGVYAATRSIKGRQAEVSVRVKLHNDGAAADGQVVARLLDADGKEVARASSPVGIASGAGAEVQQSLTVARARLWQGEADPYLYRLSVDVRSASGKVLDRLDQPFGIRQMRLDPARGFLLNGKPLRLRGVGLHQDLEGKGWAMSDADVAADVGMIRDMGANTIRLTHYQHDQTTHDLADRYGLILWDEIPLVTRWTLGSEQKASPGLEANARQQLTELIRQNYNHPSVAVWGIANELDLVLGVAGGFGDGASPADPAPLLKELNALAKAEDPSRASTLATCCEARGVANAPVTSGVTDTVGHNRYFGWYYGQVEELGPHLDALHALRPSQPIAVTEYGAGGALSLHTDDPHGAPPDSRGSAQPEEVESDVHERSWPILSDKPYLWATWLWNMFDFGTTVRKEGDTQDINTKGLVTYDRKTHKDAFYFYQANWSRGPVVHINGRRYIDRAYGVTDVRVYSNAPATEAFLNGRSLGRRKDCPARVCVWTGVHLAAGANAVEAVGRFAKGARRDAISWTLAPEGLGSFRIDSGALVPAAAGAKRFGSDAFFVGGTTGTTSRPARQGAVAPVQNTGMPEVLATFREGDFRYRVPLSDGPYTVTLSFVEPKAAKGERVFDVLANGAPAVSGLDIAAQAGGPMKALTRTFVAQARGGLLELQFRPSQGSAIVSALEITPVALGADR